MLTQLLLEMGHLETVDADAAAAAVAVPAGVALTRRDLSSGTSLAADLMQSWSIREGCLLLVIQDGRTVQTAGTPQNQS